MAHFGNHKKKNVAHCSQKSAKIHHSFSQVGPGPSSLLVLRSLLARRASLANVGHIAHVFSGTEAPYPPHPRKMMHPGAAPTPPSSVLGHNVDPRWQNMGGFAPVSMGGPREGNPAFIGCVTWLFRKPKLRTKWKRMGNSPRPHASPVGHSAGSRPVMRQA